MQSSLASTPPLGWNSWNTFGHNINETVVRETVDALVSSGLKDYVNHCQRRFQSRASTQCQTT